MPFCPSCGHNLDTNAQFCPSCGRQLTPSPAPEIAPPPPPNSPYLPTSTPSVFGEEDRKALRKLTIFSAIFLASIVISFVSSILLVQFLGLNRTPSGTAPFTFSFASDFLTIIAISFLFAIVVETVTFQQLRSAFKGLATIDRSHFRIPSILTLLLMIVVPIILLGDIVLFSGMQPFLNQIGQNGGQTFNNIPQGTLDSFLVGGLVGGIGGILALVGIIGGPILGLWRMGSRYDNTLIKVAAILFIIPLLDLISPILLLVGAHQSKNRIPPAQTS